MLIEEREYWILIMKEIKMKWGNPLFEVQEFAPQEYITSCDVYTVRKHGRTHNYWLDLNGNTIVDQGEAFDSSGYNGSNSGYHSNVNVYRWSSSLKEYESTPCDNDSFTIKDGYAYNVS